MILYDNRRFLGYSQYFHVFGSAIFTFRSAPQSVVGAAVGYYATQNADELTDYIVNPTAYFSAISLVLGFLLVFRTQLAYMRYWEGRTSFQTLMSKLEDVGIHTKTFVRLNDSEAIKWKNAMGHMLINYLALAMAELRGERDLDEVVTKYNLSLTPDQREELEAFSYRAYIAMSWIMDAWCTCYPAARVQERKVRKNTLKGIFALAWPLDN
ncbi:hypothetical protein CYMTET_14063 [Cymbomonas tetramitiformis]|uniref:Uncharacterized protein n=1 Tax=Cymbomonas tetramitiformis TaxID=36881 RepID=A0AAE0LAD9_9CHLO|nr:hypothetical protein CYMTET_14063 [Cymbomonas tetramitiformis]